MFKGMKSVWSGIADYVGTNSSVSKTPNSHLNSRKFNQSDDENDYLTPERNILKTDPPIFKTTVKAKEKYSIKQ